MDEEKMGKKLSGKKCVVIAPRHDFLRSWIRAYFARGNTCPLVIAGRTGHLDADDREFCQAAAAQSGGVFFDCDDQMKTNTSIIRHVATNLSPQAFVWADDTVEIVCDLGVCFERASGMPGFVLSCFDYPNGFVPDGIDNRHYDNLLLSRRGSGTRLFSDSFVLFHDANTWIDRDIRGRYLEMPLSLALSGLYLDNSTWHEAFYDFSLLDWKAFCRSDSGYPTDWFGVFVQYEVSTGDDSAMELWAKKHLSLPIAPCERIDCEIAVDAETVGQPISHEDDVDAVFVIGTGSVNGNEELRYALRNLDKHCPFVRNVYICGECPKWVDKSIVKHLQWPDRFVHAKDANIIDKLRHACEQPGIAKKILFCSDDQFQTHVCTWEDFRPRYLRKYNPADTWYRDKRRVWHTRLARTLARECERRKANGEKDDGVYYYQPHIWMPIDRDRFIEYAKWCGYENRDDTIIASGYFNFIHARGVPDFDHVFVHASGKMTLRETHVAYHDGSYHHAMEILKGLFPSRCRFESGNPGGQSAASNGHVHKTKSMPIGKKESVPRVEMEEIAEMVAAVRANRVFNPLLGEISKAEEMRLSGADGWQRAWRHILDRWAYAASGRLDAVTACTSRSKASTACDQRQDRSQCAANGKTRSEMSPRIQEEDFRDELHRRIRSLARRT